MSLRQCRYYDHETHIGMFCGLGKDLREMIYADNVTAATEKNVVQYLNAEHESFEAVMKRAPMTSN